MATISVSVAAALINPANYFAVGIYDASSGTLLETIAPPKGSGYLNPFQVTGVNSYTLGKVYRVIVWENTTAVVGGTSRVSGSVTPSSNSTTLRAPNYLTYGIDAVFTNNTTIVDPSMIGWDIIFEQIGYGPLVPGSGNDYTYDKTTGTIVLVNGTTYANGQKMVVFFQPQVSASVAPSAGISTGRIVAVNSTLTNSDSNSAIYLQGSGGSFVATLPALSTMSDYQPIEFYSFGGNHIYATLLCQGSDKIQWQSLRTKLFMRQATNLILFKANGVWNVKGDTSPMSMVGEIAYKYTNTDLPYILADGSVGGLISRASYAGLFDYVQSLPGAAVTTEANWGNSTTLDGIAYYPYKGLWTMGDGSTTFRVPLLINQFIRGAGLGRNPGSFQADSMATHEHPILMGGVGGTFLYGYGPIQTVGGDTGGYSLHTDMSGPPYNAPGSSNPATILAKIGTENRPQNIALYAQIRL